VVWVVFNPNSKSLSNETKARRILDRWQGVSEAHIRSDLQRASNEASGPKDKRIGLILKAIWNGHRQKRHYPDIFFVIC